MHSVSAIGNDSIFSEGKVRDVFGNFLSRHSIRPTQVDRQHFDRVQSQIGLDQVCRSKIEDFFKSVIDSEALRYRSKVQIAIPTAKLVGISGPTHTGQNQRPPVIFSQGVRHTLLESKSLSIEFGFMFGI